MNLRPSRLAATPVVPAPQKGSSISSPSRVEARTIRSSRYSGFWVGWPPSTFSDGLVSAPRHTSFICLPPLSSFMAA